MALTLQSTLSLSLTWSQTDTQENNTRINDLGQITYSTGFNPGTGYGLVNLLYRDVRTIASGVYNDSLDLSSLTRDMFGSSINVDFSGGTVKALVIENLASTGTGLPEKVLRINGTGSNGFTDPFGGATGVPIYPGTPFVLANRVSGWSIGETNRIINLVDTVGDGLTYEIAIIGVNT